MCVRGGRDEGTDGRAGEVSLEGLAAFLDTALLF